MGDTDTHLGVTPSSTERKEWRTVFKELASLGVPLASQFLCDFSLGAVAFYYVSRMGVESLAATSLAQTLFNVTGLSIQVGLCGAMETMCGQAYGASNFRMMGIVLQRAMLIGFTICGPMIVAWRYADAIMIALRQDPAISAQAGIYLRALSPGILAIVVAECVKHYQTAQNDVVFSAVATLVVLLVSPFMFYEFTHTLEWGLQGVALAYNICLVTVAILLVAWSVGRHIRRASHDPQKQLWTGFSWQAWKDWGEYLSLAVPSTVMMCMEWWMYEAVTLMAGWLPNHVQSLALINLCFQIASLTYSIPLGLSGAACVRISNDLGAGNPKGAKRTAVCACIMAALAVMAFISLLLPAREALGRFWLPSFADDEHMLRVLSDTLLIMAMANAAEWQNCVLDSILRACGKQDLGARINVITYWGFGPCLLWLFAFKLDFRVRGLYIGILLVAVLQFAVLATVCWRLDWDEEAAKAAALTGGGSPVDPDAGSTVQESSPQDVGIHTNLITVPLLAHGDVE